MQRPSSQSDQASATSRERCGRCAHYCQSPVHEGGICALTNGDLKKPGTVQPTQQRCIFSPSKFTAKGFQR